jgi:hypothetical protein
MTSREEEQTLEYAEKMKSLRKQVGVIKEKRIRNQVAISIKELPTFNGEFEKWPVFKRIFNLMIGDNEDLEPVEKERYLLQVCTDEALQRIIPFSRGPDAFNDMMTALTDYYDNPDKIRENILSAIRKLPFITSRMDENVADFKTKALIIVKHVQEYPKVSDDFCTRVVTEFLNRWHPTLRQWFIRKHETMQDIVKVLEEFYAERERAIKFGELKLTDNKKGVSVVVTSSKPHDPRQCAFCSGSHFTSRCDAESRPSERRNIAVKNRLCFNCLRPNHNARQCESRGCKHCGLKHHSLLHIAPPTMGASFINPVKKVETQEVETVGQSVCRDGDVDGQ